MAQDAIYRHSQTYTVLWLITFLSVAVCVPLVLTQAGPDSIPAMLMLGTSMLGCVLLLGRLVIEVRKSTVHWSFGYVGWPSWSAPLAEIARVEVAKADLVYGSGIKRRGQHRQYNTVINGPAVRLQFHDGRSVTLGTPEPQRLLGFIEPRLAHPRR